MNIKEEYISFYEYLANEIEAGNISYKSYLNPWLYGYSS